MELENIEIFVSTIHLVKTHLDWSHILCTLNYDFSIATLFFSGSATFVILSYLNVYFCIFFLTKVALEVETCRRLLLIRAILLIVFGFIIIYIYCCPHNIVPLFNWD